MDKSEVDLAIELLGITLTSPVLNASGTFGPGSQDIAGVDFSMFGAAVTKTVTLEPKLGNLDSQRLFETGSGLINRIGLENGGIGHFLAEELPVWCDFGVPVIINISGNTTGEFVQLANLLNRAKNGRIIAIEANLSCPNVEKGLVFSTDLKLTGEVIKALVAVSNFPLIVKLTPNVTDIGVIAQAAEANGASAISAVNTFKAMAINPETGKPIIVGGYSGSAIMPMALQKVWEIHQAVKIPVIGMGGISSGLDAIKFLQAGATAVAVGTASFKDPLAIPRIVGELRTWLADKGIMSLSEIPGREKAS